MDTPASFIRIILFDEAFSMEVVQNFDVMLGKILNRSV
jgi:hypothetical protein